MLTLETVLGVSIAQHLPRRSTIEVASLASTMETPKFGLGFFTPNFGCSSQRSTEAFTTAYNLRMREYIANPDLYKPHGVAANGRAD
jgi:hypothetical protein